MPFNPNRINIHELTIEEPEKPSELPFDPVQKITEEDWTTMEELLEHYKESYNERRMFGNEKKRVYGWDFSNQAKNMRILDPTKDLYLEEDARECMSGELKERRSNKDWAAFSVQAANMKIIDPTQDLGLNQTAWNGMKKQLEEYRLRDQAHQWKNFSAQAMRMKILDPNQDLNLDQSAWQHMTDELEYYRTGGYWDSFAYQAMIMKVIDQKYDLKLDQATWQGMRGELEALRQENETEEWKKFISLATEMKILAAEEVKVTDRGLEIKMRKDKPLTSSVPPLPETKQF